MKRLTTRNFNIADWFSFYRIIAAPVLIVLLLYEYRLVFAILLAVSYLTDALDGFLARKLKITSPRGSQLDSMGDQLTFALGLIGLYVFEEVFILNNLIIILIAFSPYFLQMLLAYVKYGKATAFHTYLAKFSAVVQSAFILVALFWYPEYWLFYLMIAVGILETIEEITLIFMYPFWTSDVKNIFWAMNDKRRIKKKRRRNN